MARSNDFLAAANELIKAMQRGDAPNVYDRIRTIFTSMDDLATKVETIKSGSQSKNSGGGGSGGSFISKGTSTAMRTSVPPRAIASGSELRAQFPLRTPSNSMTVASIQQVAGVDDPSSGYSLDYGMDVDNEVYPQMAVNYQNGALRLATAADPELPCSGITVRTTNISGQFAFRDGGLCYARVKLPIVSYANRLYLSVDPGFLTTDPAEPGKAFNQEVGRFRTFLPPNEWQADGESAIAIVSFQYSPVS